MEDVDCFLESLFCGDYGAMSAVLEKSAIAGLAPIAVSPLQGAFLSILVSATSAQRVLEIGALGGYSTLWLARGLGAKSGLVKTLDIDPKSVATVRANAKAAGFADKVEVIEGPAGASLQAMIDDGEPPFDFVFIDADKENYPLYLEFSLRLARPGALIVADNAVWKGEIVYDKSDSSAVKGLRAYLEKAAADPRLKTTVIQTVGAKGHDGFAFSLVL